MHAYWPVYPAEDALFLIGKPAIPDLIAVVAASDTSDPVRASAAWTLHTILSGEPTGAVATLVKASKAATDVGASDRLLDAAKSLANRCPPDTKSSA